MFCLLAETSSLLLSVEMLPSSKCGVSFSYKVEKYVVAWGAEEPKYSIGIMADLQPGNLWINWTINVRLTILESKHSPLPKGIVQHVYGHRVSWEEAFYTIVALGRIEELPKK